MGHPGDAPEARSQPLPYSASPSQPLATNRAPPRPRTLAGSVKLDGSTSSASRCAILTPIRRHPSSHMLRAVHSMSSTAQHQLDWSRPSPATNPLICVQGDRAVPKCVSGWPPSAASPLATAAATLTDTPPPAPRRCLMPLAMHTGTQREHGTTRNPRLPCAPVDTTRSPRLPCEPVDTTRSPRLPDSIYARIPNRTARSRRLPSLPQRHKLKSGTNQIPVR